MYLTCCLGLDRMLAKVSAIRPGASTSQREKSKTVKEEDALREKFVQSDCRVARVVDVEVISSAMWLRRLILRSMITALLVSCT